MATSATQIQTDSNAFRRGVQALAKAEGKAVSDVMRTETGILAGQLVKKFPPKTKKEGRQAIEGDLKKIIFPMTETATLNRWADTMEDVHDVFDPEGVRIQDWHEKYRKGRTGRVHTNLKTKRIGNRDFSKRLHVQERHFKQYVRRVSQSVGGLKAGWLAGTKWGGKKPPQWVGKLSEKGTATDRMRKDGSGYLEIRNKTPYASRWNRINLFVVKSRTRGMAKALSNAIKKAEEKTRNA